MLKVILVDTDGNKKAEDPATLMQGKVGFQVGTDIDMAAKATALFGTTDLFIFSNTDQGRPYFWIGGAFV
jgi:hypothetical protein